jgi:hypothetical protein
MQFVYIWTVTLVFLHTINNFSCLIFIRIYFVIAYLTLLDERKYLFLGSMAIWFNSLLFSS